MKVIVRTEHESSAMLQRAENGPAATARTC